MAPAKTLYVIDPVNRTGKIAVPVEMAEETRGLAEFLRVAATGRQQRDMSLCLLFQKGRCNAGTRCHQIHADRDLVARLRVQATTGSSCCADHGDMHSLKFAGDCRRVHLVAADGSVTGVHSLGQFGATQALENIIRATPAGAVIRVTMNKICRLHGQARCKFGRDCKNIHVCRDAANDSKTPSQASTASTPAVGSPTLAPVDAAPALDDSLASRFSTPLRPTIKRTVMPPQPADFFRLEDAVSAPTPSKEAAVPVGFSPMSASFAGLPITPASTMTASSTTSKNSAIVRPLLFDAVEESATTQRTDMSDMAELFSKPLTRSKIGISPNAAAMTQCDLDMARLCQDMLGSLSPSWVMP